MGACPGASIHGAYLQVVVAALFYNCCAQSSIDIVQFTKLKRQRNLVFGLTCFMAKSAASDSSGTTLCMSSRRRSRSRSPRYDATVSKKFVGVYIGELPFMVPGKWLELSSGDIYEFDWDVPGVSYDTVPVLTWDMAIIPVFSFGYHPRHKRAGSETCDGAQIESPSFDQSLTKEGFDTLCEKSQVVLNWLKES